MEPKFILRTVFLELGVPLIGFGQDQLLAEKVKLTVKEKITFSEKRNSILFFK